MTRFPAHSFAHISRTDDGHTRWQTNQAPTELNVGLFIELEEKVSERLREKWGNLVFLSAKSEQNYSFDEMFPAAVATFIGYAISLSEQNSSALNPYLISRMRLFDVGLLMWGLPHLSRNEKRERWPTLFWLNRETVTDIEDVDKWAGAWATSILQSVTPNAKGQIELAPMKAWWQPFQKDIQVFLYDIDRWEVALPIISDVSDPHSVNDSSSSEQPHSTPDAPPELAAPPKPCPTHRVVNVDDFRASHPDEHENEWCKRLIQQLGDLPLRQWPEPLTGELTSLRVEFPWAHEALDHLELLMAFWRKIGEGVIRLPPIVLVGAAGCGKTRLAKRIGECLALPTMLVSAIGGGSQQIKGTERAWSNGTPSSLVRFVADRKCPNPLVVVDEIDKQEENRWAGTLQHALLGFVEPENARVFRDSFLEVPCDLSAVNWVMTANDASALCGPLLSRVEVIRVGHPRPEHLGGIAEGVRQDLARQAKCALDQLPWTEQDLRWVRQQMGAMFSVREARKLIEKRLMVSVTQERPALSVVAVEEGTSSSNDEAALTKAAPKATVVPFSRGARQEPGQPS